MMIFGRPVSFKTVSIAIGFVGTVIGVIIGAYKIAHDISATRAAREEIRVQISIGDEFLNRHEYEKAILEYEKAIEVDKDDIESNLRMIRAIRSKFQLQVYTDRAEADDTLARIYRLRALEPSFNDNRDLMVEEALIFKADRRFNRAMDVLDKARALHPDDNDILAELGYLRALTSKGEKTDGLDLLRKAVERAPEDARYHYYLAETAERAGLAGEAARVYLKTARLSTGRNAWNRGVRLRALDELYRIFNRMGKEEEGGHDRVLLPTLDMPLEERARALEYLIEARKPDGRTRVENPFLYLARIYYELGEKQKAADTLRAALPKDREKWKKYGPVLRYLARILEEEGSGPEALVEVKDILNEGEKDTWVLSPMGGNAAYTFIHLPGYLK
jgi:tetratricopeptide (TPR) repeat protein